MKKAYVVAEIHVTNPEAYEGYRALSTASINKFGGQIIVRGGQREQCEGADAAHSSALRTVIIEFASQEHAKRWYESVEYTHAKVIRQANSVGRLFIVEGV